MNTPQDRAGWLDRLAGIPARIERAIEGIANNDLRRAAGGDWSIADVLAHVRASDDIVAYRAYAVLARDNPPLPAYDERRWAVVAGYEVMDVRASLNVFGLRRAELVALLRRATAEDWQRTGEHEVRGPISLGQIVASLVEHEEEHCGQIEAMRTKRL